MKIRRSIVAAGAAVVLGGTAAFLVPAVASAHDASHTLTFTATAVNSVMFTPTTRGVQDTDTNSAGTTIGFDNLYLTFTSVASASGTATLDIKGGFLYATLATTNGGQTFSGKVTGGTGAFTGATGRVAAKATNPAGSVAVVTITYNLQNSQGQFAAAPEPGGERTASRAAFRQRSETELENSARPVPRICQGHDEA